MIGGDSKTDIHVQLSQIPCKVHKIRIQILCYFLAKKVYQFCSTVLAACRIGDFLFRVFEASEGKREAGVEHETRPTGDNCDLARENVP